MLINSCDQLGTTYNCNFHGRYAKYDRGMVGINQGRKRRSNNKARKVRMVNTIDLPYPVGKEMKLSVPDNSLWT